MPGLLSFFNDPEQMGLLGLSSGLLQAGGPSRLPVGFGSALGQGLQQGAQNAQATQQFNNSNQLQQAQLKHLGNTDALTELQVQQLSRQQGIQEAVLRQLGLLPQAGGAAPSPSSSVAPSPVAAASGGTSAVITNPSANPPRGVGAIPDALRTPIGLDFAFNGGKGAGGMIATYNKPVSGRAGAPLWGVGPDGKMQIIGFSPKVDEGMTVGANGEIQVAPGYAKSKEAINSIPNPSAAMQTIKLSNGQELQLSQPEYLRYTQSGGSVLPSRYRGIGLQGATFSDGQAQTTAVQTPPAVPGGAPAAAPPVVGATQSNAEQITQQRQTAAGKAVDEAFAKDYVAFTTGGAQDATKQLAQLKDVQRALANPKENLTGPIVGRTPDFVKTFSNPKSIAMRERVEEVVQRSLRVILGAQFTEKEGERLIARAYNPNLGEKENAVRVGRLLTQLEQAYQSKAAAAAYFEKNGTLEGWQGKLPSLADFNPDGDAGSNNDPLGIR